MDFDFNLILVPLTLLFLGIWLLDKLVFKQRKEKGKGNENPIISWAYDFWPVLAFVLCVRSFFIEPYNIPSSSMVPTLYTGDFILVNKYDYGFRLPLINKKIIPVGEPKRGDVVVFRYPENPSIYFIKRTVGLPGDTVSFKNGMLSINGNAVSTIENTTADLDDFSTVYNEKLGENTHLMRDLDGINTEENATFLQKQNPTLPAAKLNQSWTVKVPDGQYFMMGDNRDESADSRFWGFVPEENLSGKAVYVWMHKKPGLNMPNFSKARKIQ